MGLGQERIELLLKRRQPRNYQVDVLETEPVAVGRALPQQGHGLFRLALAHRHLLEAPRPCRKDPPTDNATVRQTPGIKCC